MTPLYAAEKYTYRVLWSEDHQRYVGVCTELPALSYQSTTHAEALAGIIARVAGELEDRRRTGEDLPVPTAIQRFRKDLER